MSRRGPGTAFDFGEFCDWLDHLGRDRAAHELLRVILGEPRGADLGIALGRARSIATAMTLDERNDPRRLDRSRRAEIAAGAGVDVSDVSELILRYGAAVELVEDHAELGRMVHRQARPHRADPYESLWRRRERDLGLWDFVSDLDPVIDL